MSTDTNIPDFDFSGFYYGEILDALLDYLRRNVPEISNTSPYEPAVQILRAYALVGHLNNTLLDMVANESMLSSAKLRESVVRLLGLIGYVPHANIPSKGYVRVLLGQSYNTSTLIIPDNAQFGTKQKATTPPIIFEADNAITINRTDEIDGLFDVLLEGPNPTLNPYAFVDYTTSGNTGALLFDLLTGQNAITPGGPQAGSTFYVGHSSALTNSVAFEGITAPFVDLGCDQRTTPTGLNTPNVVWEYYDGELDDAQPDAVVIQGAGLRVTVQRLLGMPYPGISGSELVEGNQNRAGQWIRVQYTANNVVEWCLVQWDDTTFENYVLTTSYLGQVSPPSTTPSDYSVGSYWHEIQDVTDGTAATVEVSGEGPIPDNGSGDYESTLDFWPVQPETRIVWNYTSGAIPKTATLDLSDDTKSGDAGPDTAFDNTTGVALLDPLSPPDAGTVFVTYTRTPVSFREDGVVRFTVPMTKTEDWFATRLDDAFPPSAPFGPTVPNTDAYWLRYRIISLGTYGSATPTTDPLRLDRVKWDQEQLFLRVPVTQGSTTTGEILGNGDGTQSQSFTLSKSPVIDGSVLISVDGTLWTSVEDFVSSDATDEVYIVRVDSDGVATITFGDGVNGKACPTGVNNVSAEYRTGGAEDGNVGSEQIIVNRSGLSRIRNVTNPRSLTGWEAQEGSGSEDELEKLKRDGVASLRTLERAVTPSDFEYLATVWRDVGFTDQQPFTRARAIENGYGPKTIKLVLVPIDGIVPSNPDVRERLEVYFNGDTEDGGSDEGVGLVNTETKTKDYVPASFTIEAEIKGGDKDVVQAALLSIFQPEAKEEDGQTYRWDFGQTISTSKIVSLIFGIDRNIRDVTLNSPISNVTLAEDSLPLLDLSNITITEVS